MKSPTLSLLCVCGLMVAGVGYVATSSAQVKVAVGNSAAGSAAGAAILTVDASAAIPAPVADHLHLNPSARATMAPNGDTIGINNQYLELNGQPWLPVMGELHYSRVPADRWKVELQKMKSAGVSIVSSYVIWNHHEAQQGKFDWKGNRDLNKFLTLCRQVGLYAIVRVGPWAHAEVRFGGLPDWVVNAMPTRSDDPQYLHYARRFYEQIGQQLQGQLWKQGGPVVGVQIENEYNLSGSLQGAAHIHTLKQMAMAAGMDVPLYTVTGWDNTVYPQGQVVPVFGGYPDEPWAVSQKELPPKETYAFRFHSRVSGDLGAQTAATAPGTAERDARLTPFLGAEFGAGLPAMYRRRTVVSPDDIAAMLPVQLGSGVNLMGYYLFHGGRNPLSAEGRSMQESSASGGYNDTPMISYDFQAPLGPDGQQRAVLELLRSYHYFLHDFGSQLAAMAVREPDTVSANEADLHTLRWSVRSKGNSGFLFVNNHVRQYPMARHEQVQFAVKLADQTITLPEQRITIEDGSYFIWPINLDLGGIRLRYATAQPVARLDQGTAGLTYVFAATQQQSVELAFDASVAAYLSTGNGMVTQHGDTLIVHQPVSDSDDDASAVVTIAPPHQRPVRLLLLSAQQARHAAIGSFAGQRRILISASQTFFTERGIEVHSVDTSTLHVAVYPALTDSEIKARKASAAFTVTQQPGELQAIDATLPPWQFDTTTQLLRLERPVAPVQVGGTANAALAPKPESFASAAAWQIGLPLATLQKALRSGNVDDVLCDIDFVGDIGRLFAGTDLIDDWYYWGYRWQVGLKQHVQRIQDDPAHALTLSVLPLRADAPIYLPQSARPDFLGKAQIARLNRVTLHPVYKLSMV